jgi:hypothetical protein
LWASRLCQAIHAARQSEGASPCRTGNKKRSSAPNHDNEPQRWPAATKEPWKKDDYRVLTETNVATVGIEKNGETFYFLKEQSQPAPCSGSAGEAPSCLLLPNGQRIEVSAELAIRLPQWRILNSWVEVREHQKQLAENQKANHPAGSDSTRAQSGTGAAARPDSSMPPTAAPSTSSVH